MLVIGVIAILTAIALPSYQAATIKSARADAKTALANFLTDMIRHSSTNNTLKGSYQGSKPLLFPSEIPLDSDKKNYDITIIRIFSSSQMEFWIRATPKTGSVVENDGWLQINHAGIRAWDKSNNKKLEASEYTWE